MTLESFEIVMLVLGTLISVAVETYDYVKHKKPLWEKHEEDTDE